MFGIEALDVVIGLIFIYLLFSLFVSIVNEMIVSFFQIRGKELQFFIYQMVGPFFLKKIYTNSKIINLSRKSPRILGKRILDIKKPEAPTEKDGLKGVLPTELSAENFAQIFIEEFQEHIKHLKIDQNQRLDKQFEKVILSENDCWTLECYLKNNPDLKQLYKLVEKSNNSLTVLEYNLINWYQEMEVSMSDWYKRKLRWFLFFLGFIITIAFNVDSIEIFKTLKNNPQARAAVVQQAEAYVATHKIDEQGSIIQLDTNGALLPDSTGLDSVAVKSTLDFRLYIDKIKTACKSEPNCDLVTLKANNPTIFKLDSTYTKLDELINNDINQVSAILGLGWDFEKFKEKKDAGVWDYICHFFSQWSFLGFIGWIITSIAISMGAPFWFDLLRKVINIKNDLKGKGQKRDGALG